MSVEVVDDDLWVCSDCAIVIANGDWTWLDMMSSDEEEQEKRKKEIEDGLEREAPAHWVMNGPVEENGEQEGDDFREFDTSACDCCGGLPGARYRAALLKNE